MSSGTGLLPRYNRVEVLVASLLAAIVLGGVAFAASLVVAAMTATGALATGTSLWLLLALLLAVLVCGVVAAGATFWLARLALAEIRTATVSSWRRLLWTGYRRARAFEEGTLLGRLLRPTRLFVGRGDREGYLIEELKTRYVAGEVDERGFERELGRLLGGGADVGERVRREIEVTATDGGGERGTESATAAGTASSDPATGSEPSGDGDREGDREAETG